MKIYSIAVALVTPISILTACAREPAAPPHGPRVAVDVAPLTLANVQAVEYALAVFNAAPTSPMFDVDGAVISAGNLSSLVWQENSLTSTLFGNGPDGDLSYVGPCDASVAENWVGLVLRNIDVGDGNGSYDGTGALAGNDNLLDDENSAFTVSPGSGDSDPDFDNPCDFAAPCVMKFRCAPNEDTEVVFNLTIMRDAEQGFFDVAIDFEDVFCSMKVDTCYDGTDPIELLFDEDGDRVPTAVIAAACSAGVGDSNTVMWMGPVEVTCDGGASFTIDPTGDDDNDPATPGLQGNSATDAALPGALITAGAASTGTLTFTLTPASGTTPVVTIPQGTPVTRSDTGLNYLTDAAITIDTATSTTAQVGATAAVDGVAHDGATSFVSILVPSADGTQTVQVSGAGFAGGLDPVYGAGIQTVVGYSLYWGSEDLSCTEGGASCNKAYWNIAINIDDLSDAGFTNCRVTTAITASGSPALSQFENGSLAGPGETYGFVDIDAPLLDGNDPACYEGPMGSEYADTVYGSSPDMTGALLFPTLCYYFERGDASPRSLGDAEGYFTDVDARPQDATYAGRIPHDEAATPLELRFDRMGGDSTGLCRSRVLNTSSAVYFDDVGALTEFSWKGSWVGSGDLGAYSIEVYTRIGTGPWIIRGGYTVDLRVDAGRAFFTYGATFPTAGDTAVAMVVTRTDAPMIAPIDLRIDVGP